jgi:RHS repeat-associated protein
MSRFDATSDSYIKLIDLRSRLYSPETGRFLTRDSWQGDYNRPLSLNRWNYTEGNPINRTDPSGNSPEASSQILSSTISPVSGVNILAFISHDCSLITSGTDKQYDLTEYLALAMTKHGQDTRVKEIANLITYALPASTVIVPAGSAMLMSAYLKFYNLEAGKKEWDLKINIKEELKKAIVLCGNGIQSCDWFDYSTVGNIHFGYIAGVAKINYLISGVAGGYLEQKDLTDEWKNLRNLRLDHCGWTSGVILFCDNPHDQYAVDFGFELAKKYPKGISGRTLKNEIETAMYGGLFGMLQEPPAGSIPKNTPALPQINHYNADHFNYYE